MDVQTKDNEDDAIGGKPSGVQFRWLERGLEQAGGKLPLFDYEGHKISSRTVNPCLKQGWVEPLFNNPIKPDWLVCKLTESGRKALEHK